MIKHKRGPGYGREHEHDEMPDPEKIKEILNAVSDRVPELLRNLSDVLYGADQAKKFGKAAAVFYKELKGTGMSNDQIFELTRQYMSTLNIGSSIGKMARGHEQNSFDEEIGKHVRKKVGKELK
jgi:hypothetical protein